MTVMQAHCPRTLSYHAEDDGINAGRDKIDTAKAILRADRNSYVLKYCSLTQSPYRNRKSIGGFGALSSCCSSVKAFSMSAGAARRRFRVPRVSSVNIGDTPVDSATELLALGEVMEDIRRRDPADLVVSMVSALVKRYSSSQSVFLVSLGMAISRLATKAIDGEK